MCYTENKISKKRTLIIVALMISIMIFLIPYLAPVSLLENAWHTDTIQVDGSRMKIKGHTVEPEDYIIKSVSFDEKDGIVTVNVRGIKKHALNKVSYQTSFDAEYLFDESIQLVMTSDGAVLWKK